MTTQLSTIPVSEPIPVTPTTQDDIINTENIEDTDGFIEVKYNKRRTPKKMIVGTSKDSNSFGGVKKKVWLYIGRVQPGTECEHIVRHLEDKIPNSKFTVEKLNTPHNDFVSFKVGADFELYDKLHNIELWPEGIIVRRYNFFRNRRIDRI